LPQTLESVDWEAGRLHHQNAGGPAATQRNHGGGFADEKRANAQGVSEITDCRV
jgi:hypothetical protein